MKIKNVNGYSAEDLQREADKGAKFVYYNYSISLLLTTLKRSSGIYMIKPGENAARKGLPYTLLTFLFGWWAIPFGPKNTFQDIRINMKGGKDVTDEITATVAGLLLFREAQRNKDMQAEQKSA